MKRYLNTILVIAIIVSVFIIKESVFIIQETEQVVMTRFGEIVGKTYTEPGINFKVLFIYKVHFFPKNILEWDGERGQIPTRDKTFIWVDTFGRWRISDARTFYEKVGTEISSMGKLDDILDAAVRNVVTSYDLIESVRTTNRKFTAVDKFLSDSIGYDSGKVAIDELELEVGRGGMRDEIMNQAAPKLKDFGIELIDFRFKRLNYVDEVLQKVYDRMIAERKQIAEKFRSEGEGEKQKIMGKKERKVKEIHSEAYKKAQQIRGEADGKAAKIYSSAYSKSPEFYSFVKSLDMYEQSFDSTNTAILSTETDFLKYMKQYSPSR